MDTDTKSDIDSYPGKGLTPSQLVYALEKELKRVANPCLSFTEEAISELDRNASSTLATIREWRNSFAHVNRKIPLDILTLIPTHLSSQKDRFHAASVCRLWRRALIKRGALWSQLYLKSGEECIATLLKRAKGSALDVRVAYGSASAAVVALISSRANQISSLEFAYNSWTDIVTFSEFNAGHLPFLRTLKIVTNSSYHQTPPSFPFFGHSIHLKKFTFNSPEFWLLSHFVFPTLTTCELSTSAHEVSSVTRLFDFLSASPMLRSVKVEITTRITLQGVPDDLVVVLPEVETFSLHVLGDTEGHVYSIAAHISCPRAKCTSLTHDISDEYAFDGVETFPIFSPWGTIFHQYTRSPTEEITFEADSGEEGDRFLCSLTFKSSEATIVKLAFEISQSGVDKDEFSMSFGDMGWQAFSQALKTVEEYPLLHETKRLHIRYMANIQDIEHRLLPAEAVGKVFDSLGPLDELVIEGCDLEVFLTTFLRFRPLVPPRPRVIFPWVKQLKILHPWMDSGGYECLEALPDLAKSQHELGIPFERMVIHSMYLPQGIEGRLARWVSEVDCPNDEEW